MVNRQTDSRSSSSQPLPKWIRQTPDGVLLLIKLQPRASVNEIGDALGEELRVKVTAPPVDSAANEALLRLLAEKLSCRRNQVELFRGQTSRHKVVKLHGMPIEKVLTGLGKPRAEDRRAPQVPH